MTRTAAIFADPPCDHWSGEHSPVRVYRRLFRWFGPKQERWRCADCDHDLGVAAPRP